ncbi:uncharacterized protein LOC142588757 [Dermacentor variabilis]|uniref:uncharacterized protein LOC142588757 n=1 Tax=Dermacentor variabilis TaxID=34621 RepID=UPI003F5CB8DA
MEVWDEALNLVATSVKLPHALERLDKARSGHEDICVALLDINAYGSIPHQSLLDALRGAGAGSLFVDLIAELYANNRTRSVAVDGITAPISMLVGICQGWPLSGLLFNLVVEPIIRIIQASQDTSPGMLQARIDHIEALASELDVALNPAKCRSLHLCAAHPVGTRPSRFTVAGAAIPTMADFDAQKFLGGRVGFRVLNDDVVNIIDQTIQRGTALLTSLLAPWQRLDAVRTFVFPGLNFMMRCGTLGKDHWTVIRTLRALQSAARDAVLRSKPNQGEVPQCMAADPTSSHFMHSGSFPRFADWRFIHKARLNLRPLNGACPWMTGRDQRCRACGYEKEALPHVLCHCMTPTMYTARHNSIAALLRTASRNRFTIIYENRPVGNTNLRPDLVMARGEEAIVLDVVAPSTTDQTPSLQPAPLKSPNMNPYVSISHNGTSA